MTPCSITPVARDSIRMPWTLQKTCLRARIVAGALVGTLEPGSYTTQLAVTNNGTGVGLIEVYQLP